MRHITIILLSLLTPYAHAGSMGRLFYTPEQRTQLEREHKRQATRTFTLTLNGIVQRSDGMRTVWINGVAQNAADHSGRTPDTHNINVPGRPLPVEIKVGQRILLDLSTSE